MEFYALCALSPAPDKIYARFYYNHKSSGIERTLAQIMATLCPSSAMQEISDLKINVSGHTFLLHQRILCSFSAKLRTMVKQEKMRRQSNGSGLEIVDFPGGPQGFELVSRFCYNNGGIDIVPSNVCLLHCSATLLEMTEGMASCNLLSQTESFLGELFHWPWSDIIAALKSCELLLPAADSCGLLQRLISILLTKISTSSGLVVSASSSSSSSSSSPDTNWEWWFDDLTVLAPSTIEAMMRTLGAYGAENKNLILTRFLLHYLKTTVQKPSCCRELYGGLADTAVYGVALIGRAGFSCRGLFWVMRVVSGLGLSRECRQRLEREMGLRLDQATLDDLLVSGSGGGGVYDVNLVLKLVRTFVNREEAALSSRQKLMTVGRLIDKYLAEISPDQSLKVSKFLEVAESLPDAARDCFDGVSRAVEIYLESHPTLSTEERTRLCGCLNYEKLTLEACKALAKNRRIPPAIAVQALVSQRHPRQHQIGSRSLRIPTTEAERAAAAAASPALVDEKEQLKLDLQRMQRRMKELERACRSIKGQMAKTERSKSAGHGGRAMPRLC